MTPIACNHPDWEWTGTGYKCKTTGCGVDARNLPLGSGAVGDGLAAGSTSPVGAEPGPGRKDDAGKPDYTLLPWDAVELVERVLAHGAAKYGRENYLGVSFERYLAAMGRHWVAVVRGEWLDPESGLPHLAHMTASGLIGLVLGGKRQGGSET